MISQLCITTVICKTYNDDDYDHVTDHLPFSSDKVEVAMKLYKVIPDVIKFVPDLNLKVKKNILFYPQTDSLPPTAPG